MFAIIGLLFGLVSFMLLYLGWRAAIERRNAAWRGHFGTLIQEAIDWGSEDGLPGISPLVMRSLRRRPARSLLTAELMSGKKALSGSAGENIARLYVVLGLDLDSLHKLGRRSWHHKAQGIQELALMEQRRHVTRIYRLTNDRNEIVRMEAQAAIVRLYGFEGLRFLDVIAWPMSEWQQIHLLRVLSRVPGSPSADVRRWLQSANPSVRDFARKLIAEHFLEDLLEDSAINGT